MANYDEDTEKFMAELSPPTSPEKAFKTGLGIATSIAEKKPRRFVKNVGRALNEFLSEKTAGAQYSKVVHVFGLLNKTLGDQWHDWEPETIWAELEIEDDDTVVKNIAMALQLLTQSNAPMESWHVFENVGNAFAGNDVNFSIVQPLELTEVAAAIKVIRMIRPQAEIEDEVCGYIAACAKTSGVVYLPEEFFPSCAQRFLDSMGNDLELRDEVKRTWPKVLGEETPLGIQTQRLNEIREYLEVE